MAGSSVIIRPLISKGGRQECQRQKGAELGAWPVVQQVWTVLNLAWGRHFCTAHQIGSQPVSELLYFLTGVSETRGPECILPNSLLSEPQSPARTSPGTCFNLESALEVMLRVKRSPCRFWCPG